MSTGAASTNARSMTALAQRVFAANWKLVELADPTAFTPTIISGRADCGIGPRILYASAEEQGKLHVIFNSADEATLPPGWPKEGGPMQVLAGIAKNVEAKGETVAAFLDALHGAVQEYQKTPSDEIAKTLIASGKDWAGYSEKALTADVEALKPAIAPDGGYLTEEAWRTTLAYQKGGGLDFVDPDAKTFSYGSMVDMSFYEKHIGKPAAG